MTQKLLIARDRLGKKPLYYRVSKQKNAFFFCSLQTPLSELAPNSLNNIALINFLHLGFIVDPMTMYQEVKSVKPMEAITLVKLKNELSYIKSRIKEPTNLPDRNLRSIITDCVMSRVHGENGVSFSLSGGLDSTVIAIVLAEQGVDATAFSVRWPDSDKDRYNQDFEIAKRTAASLNLKFMPVDALNSKEVPNYLDKYLEIMEEPSGNPTGLSMISLYQEISSSGFRLTLTGDGSDEIFGGYSRYEMVAKYQPLADWFKLSNWVKLKRIGLTDKIHRLNSSSWEDWASWHQVFSRKELARELTIASSEIDSAFQVFEEEYREIVNWDEKSALKRMMLLDQKIWLAMESNRRLDRISMFFSVEARSPFQDDQLSTLWRNRNKRQVLKQIGKRDLLDAFPEIRKLKVSEKKVGFSSPLGHWLRADMDWTIQAIKWLESAGIVKPKMMLENEIKADLHSGEYNKLQKLWTLVVLSIWLQKSKPSEIL
jgi:asparagine synthase (glutamine-hydrolysing)